MASRLRTVLCDILGIEYPVLLAGMGPTAGGFTGPVATAEVVAAVSNAGGLGVIGGAGYTPERLRQEIRKVKDTTSAPFGVDILLPSNVMGGVTPQNMPKDPRELIPQEAKQALDKIREDLGVPLLEDPKVERRSANTLIHPELQVDVILEEDVPVFCTGLGNPAPHAERIHARGVPIVSLVGNVKNARRVKDGGADVVVAQGTEAGGHTGRIGTMALVPQTIDAVAPTPVVAAGGIGDGRGLAAALAMGAVGVWCGSAFLVSEEANLDRFQKERILAATEEDTKVTRLYSGKTMRNITNPLIEAWENSGIKALPMGLQGLLIQDLIYSIREAGRDELLMNAAGQASGMLTEIRPAGDILRSMVDEAAEIIAKRLPSSVEAVPA
jgi:NAD(P)H-dependent flavin oxidoreductase YrpB (nitropropane dioxygenase family)